jgi:hypothetical protein
MGFGFVILPHYVRKEFDLGCKTGEITTKLELMDRIAAELGTDYRPADGRNVFFGVKADEVVIVERNGVKTLRRYGGKP